ncbi:heterokaryon incompatibility protein-domain-containing protein [Fusarium venenatum]|uniref:heterokaryon incompatibility protein-domain-containing protein n=1 Tax=Fusarium venenatum TaxID=56646 RepID=UPI001E0096B8|nr:heterokaryon incompatibility protein-domain-containing protein [Fusarium venenatum]
MEVPLIAWSTNSVSQSCWLNTPRMKKARPMDDIRREADDGCLQCVLKQDNGLLWVIGTDKQSGFGHKDVTYQLYYPIGTQRPEWNFVKPGRISPRSRQEEYIQRIDEWVGSCMSSHPECMVQDAELPYRVLFVGDAANNHIYLYISQHQVAPYVALSHCWGNSPVLQTTTANFAEHRNAISFQSLPKNFQHAITITRSIGLQYLWIDSLCIVQDDKADWEIESSKMASIYNDAYLVLAASQAGESSDGFLQRKDVEFQTTQQLDPTNSVKVALIKNQDSSVSEIYSRPISVDPTMGKSAHRWKITTSPLNQRGWVLQENILARRIIHFTESEMIWECVQCLKCECMEIEADEAEATHWSGFNIVRNARNATLHGKDCLEAQTPNDLYIQWRKLIDLYGRLILTKDTDRLPALSGLAKLCQSHGTGKYLAGIWENDLMVSLVWYTRLDKPVRRWPEYMAPSWSPFSAGYMKRYDGLIEAGYWYCQDEDYHKKVAEQKAHILEAQCIPAGSDPTGAVKDGYLILRGPMRKDNPDGPDCSWPASDESYLEICTIWDSVFWDRPLEEVDRSEVLFFLLCADFDKGYFKALCLLPSQTESECYIRVALVDSHWGETEMAGFFRNTEEGTVKII